MVEAFHKAAMANGGRDNGGPGERSYHPGYYAAFVRIRTATISRPCITAKPGAARLR
jgi:hypothetical protein